MRRGWLRFFALASALLLAACSGEPATDYRQQGELMESLGLLRTERDPADAPIDDSLLAQNFVRIALGLEAFGEQEAARVPLRRWDEPIRYRVFGDSARAKDRSAIRYFMDRMSTRTGLDIRPQLKDGNFVIFILDAEERRDIKRTLESDSRDFAVFLGKFLDFTTKNSPCHATISTDDGSRIRFAAVLIKAETSGRLRQACIEEELSQAMGLTNDDPDVRPSIFNDDQEFAFLTRHDEILLEMLYDPALRPGWSEDQIVPRLGPVVRRARAKVPQGNDRFGAVKSGNAG